MVTKGKWNRSYCLRRFLNCQSLLVKWISFRKNGCITTKAGLTNSLKDLIWFINVDVNTFFPRSFDLKNDDDNLEFVNEFRYSKAQAILIR
jgi:hypothetical protein